MSSEDFEALREKFSTDLVGLFDVWLHDLQRSVNSTAKLVANGR